MLAMLRRYPYVALILVSILYLAEAATKLSKSVIQENAFLVRLVPHVAELRRSLSSLTLS